MRRPAEACSLRSLKPTRTSSNPRWRQVHIQPCESAPLAAMDPYASALEQAAAIRRREVSSTELTQAHLARIESFNPRLNAYVLLTPEVALEQARTVDDTASEGDDHHLRGVSVSIKDLT